MFRTSVLRAARLPRAAGLSLASTRLAGLRIAGAPRVSAVACALDTPAILSLSSTSAVHRYYSSVAEAVAEDAAGGKEEAEKEETLKFADLKNMNVHPNIIDSITKGMGYKDMTPVQAKTIVPALAGKDMVAQAKTGTGKTLAFLIPVIQRMIAENPELAYRGRRPARPDDVQAIIMSPTRELAEQIGEEARKLVKGTGIVVQTAVGGTQKRMMLAQTQRQGCHLLVATPGRLHDLLDSRSIIAAPNLKALVLDEADRMLDVGFEDELKRIVSLLPNRKERPRQTLLFSATIPTNVIMIARSFIDPKNFEFVQTISPDEAPTHAKVPQHIVPTRGYENMLPTLLELAAREIQKYKETTVAAERVPFKAIVFLPTTHFVQMSSTVFRHLQRQLPYLPNIFHIHSKLTQNARTAAAKAFKESRSGILFSSDVTARGMDFPNVSHVIQLGVPPDREQYIHRLGRTGRAQKGGEGWVILPQSELRLARQTLVDLPIKKAGGFESADFDMTSGEAKEKPVAVEEMAVAMKRVPAGLLSDTYLSFLGGGGANRKVTQELIDGLNNWAVHGWGWSAPPPVSRSIAMKRGLLKMYGLRIGERDDMRTQHGGGGRGGASNDFQEGLVVDEQSFARSFSGFGQDSDRYPSHRSNRPTRSGYRDGRGGSGGYDRRGARNDRRQGRPWPQSPETRASF